MKTIYEVKDLDGNIQRVEAEDFACGGNGLRFFNYNEAGTCEIIVAWYSRWQWFRVVSE